MALGATIKSKITIHHFGYIIDLFLVIALGMGLYIQWLAKRENSILIIAIVGAVIIVGSCIVRIFFGHEDLGKAIFHIWIGLFLGIVAFLNNSELDQGPIAQFMEVMFTCNMVGGASLYVLESVLKPSSSKAKFLTISEGLESLGLILASLVTGVDSKALMLITVAYVIHISVMRLKCALGMISFGAFVFAGMFMFFASVKVEPNIIALTCFGSRHSFQPIIGFYFSRLTMIDRWRVFFNLPSYIRYLFVLTIFILQFVMAVFIGVEILGHKEWYIVLFLYIIVAVFWVICHSMSFYICWKLMDKITECNIKADERWSFNQIMAAKGIRYFGLVSQNVIYYSFIITIILISLGFETRTPYSIALVFIVLPLEAAIVSLFKELGGNLGGTCTGYALIAPVTFLKQGKGAQLMTSTDLMEITSRGTSTLIQLQHLFNFHMINNYGCDYSSSGLELENLKNKLKAFFDLKTPDGARFDTYLLYYSGDVYSSGNWALAENKELTMLMILEWFIERNTDNGSRLILVLDTTDSYVWAKEAALVKGCSFAIQTCRYITRPENAEVGETNSVGTFTRAYVQSNTGQEVDIDWLSPTRPLRALFRVSFDWSAFSFRLPTEDDISDYWNLNFHTATKHLLKILNYGNICLGFSYHNFCLVHWMKWLYIHLLRPRQMDTGHGFQLLNT